MNQDAAFSPRASYRDVPTYKARDPRARIELADNTSPFGVPPSALQALREGLDDRLARYPTAYSDELREAFASYVGVNADEVIVGAGSDEVMSCSFRALADPGATLAHMDPTFVMVRPFASTNSLTPIAVPLAADGDADAEALVDQRAALTYLCSPNNPTGVPVAADRLRHILERASGLILVDEAYAEYAPSNLAAQAPRHGRMLVFRTMSKAFGMAGFRVGFATGSRALISEIEKARGPYAVAALSERAATRALLEDISWVLRGVELVRGSRDWFVSALRSDGFDVVGSAANFVLVRLREPERIARSLQARGILVRLFPDLTGLGGALRISVGTGEVMNEVLVALREASACR
jgi:histidinol-phosphate aminotransferase